MMFIFLSFCDALREKHIWGSIITGKVILLLTSLRLLGSLNLWGSIFGTFPPAAVRKSMFNDLCWVSTPRAVLWPEWIGNRSSEFRYENFQKSYSVSMPIPKFQNIITPFRCGIFGKVGTLGN